MPGRYTRTQLIYLLAALGPGDPRTASAYLDNPQAVRPALRERFDRVRRERPEFRDDSRPPHRAA